MASYLHWHKVVWLCKTGQRHRFMLAFQSTLICGIMDWAWHTVAIQYHTLGSHANLRADHGKLSLFFKVLTGSMAEVAGNWEQTCCHFRSRFQFADKGSAVSLHPFLRKFKNDRMCDDRMLNSVFYHLLLSTWNAHIRNRNITEQWIWIMKVGKVQSYMQYNGTETLLRDCDGAAKLWVVATYQFQNLNVNTWTHHDYPDL